MPRSTRYLLAFGGLVGGGLLLWTGHAFASHNPRVLHTCVSQAGTIRVAQSCQALESAVVLVREEALTGIEARLAALEAKATQVDTLAKRVGDLEGRVGAVEAENASLKDRVDAVEADNTSLKDRVDAVEADNTALKSTLEGVTRSGDTLTFSEMNVQVVNGLGTTETRNGLGNLIVGYNEASLGGDTRTGSHNLVVGKHHGYSSFGGFVAGVDNGVTAPWASVSGGESNTASEYASSVSGGHNTASGNVSSVSGGVFGLSLDFGTGGRGACSKPPKYRAARSTST